MYAIEASDIAGVAEEVFEINGVADRITLVPGWSRLIDLPEQADLLVAEVIGNEPFEEEILETTLDARRRLLKPGARLLPNRLTILARPVVLPEAEVRQRAFGRAAIARWHDLYGIDFQPLLDAAIPGPVHTITEGEVVATWPQAGGPVVLASVDLATFEEPSVRSSADLVVDRPGPINAIAVTFRADLHDGIVAHARPLDVAGVQLGERRCGCSPPRWMWAQGPSCGCTITVGCLVWLTGSPARSSTPTRADRSRSAGFDWRLARARSSPDLYDARSVCRSVVSPPTANACGARPWR